MLPVLPWSEHTDHSTDQPHGPRHSRDESHPHAARTVKDACQRSPDIRSAPVLLFCIPLYVERREQNDTFYEVLSYAGRF